MIKKKVLLLFAVLFIHCHPSFAGELVAGEAQNYYREGVKLQKGGNFAAAESTYQKVLLLAPDSPEWKMSILNNRGAMYAKEGDLAKAEDSFLSALEINPNYKVAQLNLGLIYDKRRSRLESLEYWAKMFNLEEKKPRDFMIEEQQETLKEGKARARARAQEKESE